MFEDGFGKLDVAVTAVSLTWLALLWYRRSKQHLPPGPTPLPIVGNILQIPKGKEFIQYAEWGKQYGPIFTLNFVGQRAFILSTQKAVSDLFEKRMELYSGRPANMVMAAELVGWERGVALNPGGAEHLRYRSVQEQSAQSLLRALLETPKDFLKHIRLSVGGSLVDITYGHGFKVDGEDYIDYAENTHEVFVVAAKPFAFMVDLIPALKYIPRWMPGAAFKTRADKWRKDLDKLVEAPYNLVKKEIEDGVASDSYVSNLVENKSGSEHDIMWTATSLYTGGTDTSICSLMVFILLMCLNPDEQKKAQQELDEVTGGERLPTFEDQGKLPYIDATVKEVLRYWSIAPLGVPHRVMEDDVYEGYHIPVGSSVMGNIWGIMHDDTVYTSPFKFMPERFMPKSLGGLEEPDPVPTVFGWGRRICPGLHLAEASLWIYAASILATLDIKPIKNEKGEQVPPSEDYISGIINFPKPFECDIKPRSANAAALIRQ